MLGRCHKNNLNKKNTSSAFIKNFFPYFSLLIISLLWNSLFGLVRNQIPVRNIFLYSRFYSESFIINVFIIIFFFIYLKGSKTRSEIKSEEPSRKYSGSLPISKWGQFWGNPHLRATSPSNRWNTNGAWTRTNNVWRGLVSPVWRASEKSIFHYFFTGHIIMSAN